MLGVAIAFSGSNQRTNIYDMIHSKAFSVVWFAHSGDAQRRA